MSNFIFKTVFSANAAPGTNALDAFSRQLDLDTAFIQETNRFYRWFATDTSPANGDAVVLPAGANPAGSGRWIRQGPPGTLRNPPRYEVPTDTSYDFVISSRQDLVNIVPPVAGVFELPQGRYKICGNVALLAGEYLHVGNSREVYFESYAGVTVSGLADRLVLVDSSGTFQADGVNLQQQTAGRRVLEITAGTVLLVGCSFTGTTAVVSVFMSGGAFYSRMSRFFTDAGISFTGGIAKIDQCFVSGTEANVITVGGTTILYAKQTRFQRPTGAGPIARLQGSSNSFFEDCFPEMVPDTSAPMILLEETARLSFEGGSVEGNVALNGVGFRMGATLDAVVKDVFFDQLGTAVVDTAAATMDRCALSMCQGSDTVTIGVDWDAARIPTNGLIEIALAFDTATPFANHVETDALVNRKACLGSAGLLAETPIVP